jgi:hypothetical protein
VFKTGPDAILIDSFELSIVNLRMYIMIKHLKRKVSSTNASGNFSRLEATNSRSPLMDYVKHDP